MWKSASGRPPIRMVWGVSLLAFGLCATAAYAQATNPVAPEWSQYLFGQGGITGASNIMSTIEQGLISALQATGSTLASAAKAIFGALALAGFAWTFGQLAMRRTDLGEIFAELTRYLVVTGLFYFFLNNMGSIANAIIQTVNEVAGGNGTGGGNSPDTVFGKGLNYFSQNIIQNGIVNGVFHTYQQCVPEHNVGLFGPVTVAVQCDVPALGISALMLILGALVVVVYLMIAIDILILRISFWAVTYIGLILLGFGAQGSVRDIATKYLRTVGSHGMSLLAIQLIVGAGLQVFNANQYTQTGATYTLNIIGQFFEIIILYLLAHKIPYIIGAMIGGDAGSHAAGVGARAVGYAAEAGVAAGLAMAVGGAGLASGGGGGGRAGAPGTAAGGAEGPLGAAASIGGAGAGTGGAPFTGATADAGEVAGAGGPSSGLATPLGEALGNDSDGEDAGQSGAAGAEPGAAGGATEEDGREEAPATDSGGNEGSGGMGGQGPDASGGSGGATGSGRAAGGGSTAGRILTAAAAGSALAGVGRAITTTSRAAGHVAALGTGQHPGFGAPGGGLGGAGVQQAAGPDGTPPATQDRGQESFSASSEDGPGYGAESPGAAGISRPSDVTEPAPAPSPTALDTSVTDFDASPVPPATAAAAPRPGTEAADLAEGSRAEATDIAEGTAVQATSGQIQAADLQGPPRGGIAPTSSDAGSQGPRQTAGGPEKPRGPPRSPFPPLDDPGDR